MRPIIYRARRAGVTEAKVSIHASLRKKKGGSPNRSVYTRWERIGLLEKAGTWDNEANSVHGLPKVLTVKVRKKAAKKKAE
jgi:small basic protein (TIGR04137 family)